ncbi:unnamed protein product [Brassica napus]|uniref:(rape) hypothetical protein n=1 Tax=Brassica napus TaxID=3708 RepID=A0A817B5G6_BRANA|nr:unnamed protein product [Brassica napus]
MNNRFTFISQNGFHFYEFPSYISHQNWPKLRSPLGGFAVREASSLLCRFDIVPVDSPFKLQLRSYLLILQSPSMASSLLPQDLIVKPDNGLMFTILRRSSSTGSLQVPASSICFDGFVATAVKSPSDQNSGQNPAVKGFVGSEPPKIDSSVPQVENYKDAGGEDVNEDSTATVAPVDSVIVQNLVTVEVVAVASVTGTPDVAIPSDTENIPTFMAPSPTVNIGSIHAPPTSVSTTVIQAMEALPISSVATLNSTSVSDGQVLASTPSSFVEILPTITESEPSTPATIFKATVTDTPSSNSALSENAPLNTNLQINSLKPFHISQLGMLQNHAAILGDFPVTESVLLTPPPKVSNDIPPSTSGGLSFTPFTGDCTGYFNEYEMAQRSRHGRELKPSQKVQDMQWHTVRGRKSRGCRGRGRHGDQN